ncbi:hypothetical protein V6N11_061777 [Hibiscus sabdariffa]|uniref:Uncharacterized protein n=1 Tax=Hibiscus sabdariffa TaxID=183260 RepID=A0ABR1ZRD4_9ROSI
MHHDCVENPFFSGFLFCSVPYVSLLSGYRHFAGPICNRIMFIHVITRQDLREDPSNKHGQFAVVLEVFEVVPSLFMVDVRKAAGDTLEYHKFYKNFCVEVLQNQSHANRPKEAIPLQLSFFNPSSCYKVVCRLRIGFQVFGVFIHLFSFASSPIESNRSKQIHKTWILSVNVLAVFGTLYTYNCRALFSS